MKYQISPKFPAGVSFKIESDNYANIKSLIESCIFEGDGDVSKTLSSVNRYFNDDFLKCGRGGNHIWISLKYNNQRIAIIEFK